MKNYQNYLDAALIAIIDQIRQRLKDFKSEYEENKGNPKFFLHVVCVNCRHDLNYHEQLLRTHIQVCHRLGINKNAFCVQIAEDWLQRISTRTSFIQLFKIQDVWFGLSQDVRNQMAAIAKPYVKKVLADVDWLK